MEISAEKTTLMTNKTSGINTEIKVNGQSLVITLPKKGNLQQCQNCRTISLTSHPSKAMLKIILNRLKPQAEMIIAEEQADS